MRALLFKALEFDWYGTQRPIDKVLYGMPARISLECAGKTETAWVMDEFLEDCGIWCNKCISPETICQWTGLRDSGHQRIFEWDIVEITLLETGAKEKHVVFYKDGAFFFGKDPILHYIGTMDYDFRVVGNSKTKEGIQDRR